MACNVDVVYVEAVDGGANGEYDDDDVNGNGDDNDSVIFSIFIVSVELSGRRTTASSYPSSGNRKLLTGLE